MQDILKIPMRCRVETKIPQQRFELNDPAIIAITAIGMIKPELANVFFSANDKEHIGEIAIIQLDFQQVPEDLYTPLRKVFKAIKYKCLLVLKYQNKFKLSTCRFTPGKSDPNNNVLKHVKISSWIHLDCMSQQVSHSMERITTAINSEGDLDAIYAEIHDAVVEINQRGTSYAHAKRIVQGLTGNKYGHEYSKIFKYCTPIPYYIPEGTGAKYHVKKGNDYILLHDYEEIWYCLNMYQKTKMIIDAWEYKNMDEILYKIESEPWY